MFIVNTNDKILEIIFFVRQSDKRFTVEKIEFGGDKHWFDRLQRLSIECLLFSSDNFFKKTIRETRDLVAS